LNVNPDALRSGSTNVLHADPNGNPFRGSRRWLDRQPWLNVVALDFKQRSMPSTPNRNIYGCSQRHYHCGKG
jgi:hypothetical protein